MKDKVFFDSNILIYAYSIDNTIKQNCVQKLLNSHTDIIISTQTINEFVNVMTKKKKFDYNHVLIAINEICTVFSVTLINEQIIKKAIDIATKHHYSYFDSLMISSALINDCSILYTEDMHDQHTIENGLKLINPFNEPL